MPDTISLQRYPFVLDLFRKSQRHFYYYRNNITIIYIYNHPVLYRYSVRRSYKLKWVLSGGRINEDQCCYAGRKSCDTLL